MNPNSNLRMQTKVHWLHICIYVKKQQLWWKTIERNVNWNISIFFMIQFSLFGYTVYTRKNDRLLITLSIVNRYCYLGMFMLPWSSWCRLDIRTSLANHVFHWTVCLCTSFIGEVKRMKPRISFKTASEKTKHWIHYSWLCASQNPEATG